MSRQALVSSDRTPLCSGTRLIIGTITLIAFSPLFAVFTPQELFVNTPAESFAVVETIPEMSDRIAIAFKIPTSTLSNLWHSESGGDPDAVGDHGCSFGLSQQNLCANPGITKEQALDPETALELAAADVAAGHEERYTVCACVKYARTLVPGIPKGDAKDIPVNSTPTVGGIVKLRYTEGYHIAVVTKLDERGIHVAETNFKPCLTDRRLIRWNDPAIVGFGVF